MENKKQIKRKLGRDERYNACPKCGNEVYIYVDEDGDYCVGCVHCDAMNTSTYLLYDPNKSDIDTCRWCWNIWAIGTSYIPEALTKLNVHEGDYVVTDESDGFIIFAGAQNAMFDFFETKTRENDLNVYAIYNVYNGRLTEIGLSTLVDLTKKHYRSEH